MDKYAFALAGAALLGLAGCATQDAPTVTAANGCALSVQTRASGTKCMMNAVTAPAPGADLVQGMERERQRLEPGRPATAVDFPLYPWQGRR